MRYRIFDLDPDLLPFEEDINQRMRNYERKKAQLLRNGESLSDFADRASAIVYVINAIKPFEYEEKKYIAEHALPTSRSFWNQQDKKSALCIVAAR